MIQSSQLFSAYKKSAADDFENILSKMRKISINDSLIINGEIAHHEPQWFQKSSVAEASESVYMRVRG